MQFVHVALLVTGLVACTSHDARTRSATRRALRPPPTSSSWVDAGRDGFLVDAAPDRSETAPGDADSLRAAWLAGPVRAGCCTYAHGLGPATMHAEDGGYVLRIDEDVPMRCHVDFAPTGEPFALRGCRMAPPWALRSQRIPLHCVYANGRERCSGHYLIESPDRGGDIVAIERAASPPPTPPPSDVVRTARAAAWSRAPVRFEYPGLSSWRGRIRADASGRLVLSLDPRSNLERCTVALGPDGDPTALADCVPSWPDAALARRRTTLRCTRSEARPHEVTCRGVMAFHDGVLPIRLVSNIDGG